jgi:MFS family permease
MVGGIALGIVSDRLGRIQTLAGSIAIFSLFSGLAGTTDSLVQLALFRFAIGFGIGGTMVAMSVFLSEMWPEKSRAIALGALVTSYQAGVLLSGIAARFFMDWRSAFIFGAAPLLISCIVLRYFRKTNVKKDSVKTVSIDRKNLIGGSIIFGSLLVGYWASLSWIPTWIQDLPKSSIEGHEKNTSLMIHGFMAILGCIAAGPLSNFIGRRWIVSISFLGAFTASLAMFLMHNEFTAMIHFYNGLLGLFAGMAQGIMYIYLPELFSAEARASCVGFCLNAGRLVTAVTVLFIGVIVTLLGGYREALSFFALIYLVGACTVWFMPETKKFKFSS